MQDQILQALRLNDADQAVQLANQWIASEPQQAQAYRWHALALQQQGQLAQAQDSVRQALALTPDDASLHLQHAGLLLALRQLDEASEALQRSTGLNPNEFSAYLVQAHLAMARSDMDTATAQVRLAARIDPDHPEVAALEGMVALNQGDLDQALTRLSAAARALPDDARILYALGFAYLGKEMLAFAEQAFRRVLELNPALHTLQGLVVQLALRQGNLEAASQMLEVALAQQGLDAPGLRRLAAELALHTGQPLQALEHLRPQLATAAGDRQLLQLLLVCWERLNRADEARTELDAALAAPGNDQLHDLWLARLAVEPVGGEGAVAVVERWLAAMPGHLPALETRMRLHDMAREHEQAEAVAARIVALEPGRISGERRLVDGLLSRDGDAAVRYVRTLVDSAPEANRSELRTWLGEVQDRAGQQRDALRTWLDLHAEAAPQRLPLPPQAKAPASWPDMGALPDADPDTTSPIFLWGAPGSGVERVVTTLAGISKVLRADRLGASPPNDAFQNYHTLQDLASGKLTAEGLVASWRAQLPQRGLANDTMIDWLLWWDNALLWALRPQLPQGRLLVVLRDPRDMLLDWIAYGAPVPFAVNSLNEAAEWLARVMAQVATLHEQNLYPHGLLRIDSVGNDPQAMASLLEEVFGGRVPPAQAIGAPRLPGGHWRQYRDVLGAAFELLTPVAVRLGYDQD